MTAFHTPQPPVGRTRLLALLVGVPAIITAVGLSVLEAWRSVDPNSPLFAPPVAASMADAIARDDPRAAYEFIREGQNPNGVIEVSHPVLTGGRRVEVLPLVWAVATQSDGAVAMLLGFGAHLDGAAKRRAVCLAEQIGRADIAQLLQLSDRDTSPQPCPAGNPTEGVPLLTAPYRAASVALLQRRGGPHQSARCRDGSVRIGLLRPVWERR